MLARLRFFVLCCSLAAVTVAVHAAGADAASKAASAQPWQDTVLATDGQLQDGWADLKVLLQAEPTPSATSAATVDASQSLTAQPEIAEEETASADSMRTWEPMPHALVPITLAERLQTLRTHTYDDDTFEEQLANVDSRQVLEAVDRAFDSRDQITDKYIAMGVAAEAANAAGQVTAEILDTPLLDPLEFALFAPPPAPLDNVFLAAKRAFDANDIEALEDIKPLLSEHLLSDYIELWALLLKLRAQPDDPETNFNYMRFIDLRRNDYISEKATLEYLKVNGGRLNAEQFGELYDRLVWGKSDADIAAWHAYYELGPLDQKTSVSKLNAAKAIYRDARRVSSEPFKMLGNAIVRRDRSWAWDRVIILLQKSAWSEANQALRDVPRPELPASLTTLQYVLEKPVEWYNKQSSLNTLHARLGIFAALRLAGTQPDAAEAIGLECLDRKASAFWRALLWSRLGFRAATSLNPKARTYYNRAPTYALQQRPLIVSQFDSLQFWEARTALRAKNWYTLNKVIDRMPERLQQQETWIYWKGRALAARGLKDAATQQFRQIADNMTFYGKLACDWLKIPYAYEKPVKTPPTNEEINRWDEDPSLQRAQALYRMQLYFEGHREWNWAARGLKNRDFVVLAEFAKEKLLIHRMINTSLRSGDSIVQVNQRFPLPHFSLITRVSEAQNLATSWIYGLIRQESRFIPAVSSSVGAQGLMQVMPATASWLAQRLGITNYDQHRLTGIEINLVLGSAYLHMLYHELDSSYVLATAAYNAGPARARVWRATVVDPMEAAVFIETIPFYETRDYVKNVLANMQTYSKRLGKPIDNFTEFLGRIHPGYSVRSELP